MYIRAVRSVHIGLKIYCVVIFISVPSVVETKLFNDYPLFYEVIITDFLKLK